MTEKKTMLVSIDVQKLDKTNKNTWLFHEGGRYLIETSPLICEAIGFYMIMASVIKELTKENYMQQVLPYFSRSRDSIKTFSYCKKFRAV